MMPAVKHTRALAVAALLLAAGAAYLWGTHAHARRLNIYPDGWDQGPVLSEAIAMRSTNYAVVTNRNQMPLYPFYLSWFATPEQEPASFFEKAKSVSIGLSVALLAVLFVVLWWRLPTHAALNIFLITMFTVFLFKAPYCQADLLYYTLSFLAFLFMRDAVARQSWLAAFSVGLFSSLAWLSKASNLPVFALYLLFLAIRAADFFRLKNPERARRAIIALAISATVFLIALRPYLVTNRKMFGSFFYNVNSSFNVWHDSWADVKAHRQRIDEAGLSLFELPSSERMGPGRYLSTHSAGQIGKRFGLGAVETILVAAMSFGYFEYAMGYLLLLALLLVWKRREAAREAAAHPFTVAFTVLFFIGGFLLCAFYVPIAPGPRFALALFLPFMFTAAVASDAIGRDAVLPFAGRRIPVVRAFNIFLSAVLALDILQILAKGLFSVPGGG